MASVFGNVFRLSGGDSVWANVFVLGTTQTIAAGTIVAAFRSRTSVVNIRSRCAVSTSRSRTVVARGRK